MTGEQPQMPQELVHPAVGHLIVLRSALSAAITNVDAAIALLAGSVPTQPAPPSCQHPEAERELVSAMGETPRYRCKACGAEFEQEATW